MFARAFTELGFGCGVARREGMKAFLIFVMIAWSAIAQAQSVRATFTTTTKPGQFAPQNCVAVWVEDGAGAFVKTIGRWSGAGGPAGDRTIHLVAWKTLAGANDVDAVTGATRLDHAMALTVLWDMKNRAGAIVPDGTYKIRMEMTEDNATMATQNKQGTFTFVKGPNAQMQMGLSNNGFTNVSIDYSPAPPSNPVCGNGVQEVGEKCDGASCPTSCPDSGNVCMVNTLMGSTATCDAECVLEEVDCSGNQLDGGCSTTPASPWWLLLLGLAGLLRSRRCKN